MKITNSIKELITDLNDGKIVCFKTDTIWGLSANPFNKKSIENLYLLKQRDLNKPFIFLIKENENLQNIIRNFDSYKQEITKEKWPGPVSIIFDFNKSCKLLDFYQQKDTIALRMPKDKVCQNILKNIDYPLPSTSVNLEGQNPINTFEDIVMFLKDKNVTILKSPDNSEQKASEIIKFDKNNNIIVVRK